MFLKKLFPRIASLIAIASICCFVKPLQATPVTAGTFTINIAPDGAGNVVATGSGDVNLDGASGNTLFSNHAQINPTIDFIVNGPTATTNVTEYTFNDTLTGPANFGAVGDTAASSGSGSMFLFESTGFGLFLVGVPVNYVSDTLITDTSTYTGKTLANLGLTAGTHTWTMGTGGTENTVIINVSATPAPEPASFALASLCGGAMLFIRRLASRKRLA
jgi:hypothetical protein